MTYAGAFAAAVRVGWTAVRANVWPMVILWLLAAVVVLSYYHVSGVAVFLEPLARWQTQCGWSAAFLNRFFFCGVVPGVFLVSMKALRPTFPFATAFA